MHKSRRGAAFYVETILLVLFLLLSLTVLARMLGTARQLSREARQLSCAVRIAQDAAEQLAASDSREDFAVLLGARQTEDGTLARAYNAEGAPAADAIPAAYTLLCRLEETAQPHGVLLTAYFTVCNDSEALYELETQKYFCAQPGK